MRCRRRSGLAAFVLERTAYAPLRRRGAPKLAYLISAIGASYFAFNLAGKEFGRQNVNGPRLYDESRVLFGIFSAKVRISTLLIFGIAILMLIVVDRLVNVTRLGKSIRAVAQDSDTASLMGIDVSRVIVLTFVLGGLLAGAGGFLYASVFSASYTMGFSARHQSVYRCCPRRHRQRPRRDDRWSRARRRGELGWLPAWAASTSTSSASWCWSSSCCSVRKESSGNDSGGRHELSRDGLRQPARKPAGCGVRTSPIAVG